MIMPRRASKNTDCQPTTGRYAAMYKPYHLIGLELPISVLNVALRGEPTGTCREWRGDAVAVAKRALKAVEMLDGEGGYTVYAKLIPAARSRKLGAPIACQSYEAGARRRLGRLRHRRRC
jgi:predicted homoserine dehydrogenase-like protein